LPELPNGLVRCRLGALAEILATGKLGKDKKTKNTDMQIAAKMRGTKNATIILLPLAIVLAFFGKIAGAIGFLGLYLLILLFYYLMIRNFKKNSDTITKE
jgi:hypothetical protein